MPLINDKHTNKLFMYQDFINFVRETFDDSEGFIILHDPRFVGNERKYIMDAMDLDISVITTHLS